MAITPPPTVDSSNRVFISVLTGASTPPPEVSQLGSLFHSIVVLSAQSDPRDFFDNVLSDIAPIEKRFFSTALEDFTEVSVMPAEIQRGPEEMKLVFCGQKPWPTRLEVMAKFLAPMKELTTGENLLTDYRFADLKSRQRAQKFPVRTHKLLRRTSSGSPVRDAVPSQGDIEQIILNGFIPPLGGTLPPTFVVPKMRLAKDNIRPVPPENYEGTVMPDPYSLRGTPIKCDVCLITEEMVSEPRLHKLDKTLVASLQKIFKVFFEIKNYIGFSVLDGKNSEMAYIFLKPSAIGLPAELLKPIDSGCSDH